MCGLLLSDAAKRGSLTEQGADALLGALAGSRQFACAFDADGPLRKACLTSRLMGADAPDLVAQRVSAGSEAFAALQRAPARKYGVSQHAKDWSRSLKQVGRCHLHAR